MAFSTLLCYASLIFPRCLTQKTAFSLIFLYFPRIIFFQYFFFILMIHYSSRDFLTDRHSIFHIFFKNRFLGLVGHGICLTRRTSAVRSCQKSLFYYSKVWCKYFGLTLQSPLALTSINTGNILLEIHSYFHHTFLFYY